MCTSPWKGFKVGINSENGKNILKIASYDTAFVYFNGKTWIRYKPDAIEYDNTVDFIDGQIVTDFVEIPCGQCHECRLNRAREWANRCLFEMEYHKQSLFVTLTYDEKHIPKNKVINPDGEVTTVATLNKKHLSDFMKYLRQEYAKEHDNKLRFFGCGEYGSKTHRPHYHVIIFGLELDAINDLTFRHTNFQGDRFYTSKMIDKVWKKGLAVVSECTWESCCYTARYIMKKQLGKGAKEYYEDMCIEPEFTQMSRMPGIGKQYYLDHPEIFEKDFISIATGKGGRDIYPPKYFERLYEADFPDEAALRKEKRQQSAEKHKELLLATTDKSYIDILKDKDYNIRTKILPKLIREEV